jgi:predicted dehydrogenase
VIRIAFLGCDSTHTEAFANRINPLGAPFNGRAKVVSIWGEDLSQATAKATALGIDRVAATPAEAVEGVDLVMVIGRFGDSHFAATTAALNAGLPTFVDKPFTVNSVESRHLAAIARQRGIPLASASPLRFAKEVATLKSQIATDGGWECIAAACPANCTDLGNDPRLDSAFFYGIHGLEMLLELTGHDIADAAISYGNRAISVRIEFESGRSALFELIRNAPEFYEIAVYTKATAQRLNISLDSSYYEAELDALLGDFATGGGFVSLESTLAAVELLERIEQNDPFKGNAK